MTKTKYSDKVLAAQAKLKLKKVQLYSALRMSAPTFDSRMDNNKWRVSEVEILNDLLKIKA